ncbi:MAG: 4Fe-4S dicluster domain-containing protein [Saprospiraceae bacterium]|nr:4Fe-4S dicluster domain-containing protein [Saprospiraceae bacterium]
MQYGFVIDNRKCIGCHACTTACKSEHDVPIGVNRTWVKQVEKGEFPHTRRIFSVLRCNHCSDAPCVEICPVEALFYREDGIVDFDKDRCIGCKSCMQACPYDALYIDPETRTAAKCNYCAHRIDVGLEPACVIVCPEEAIISGDLDDPDAKIAQLLAQEQVTVRKAAKGTVPNLYYIDGDEASLNPMRTEPSDSYFWNAQTRGVGHFARAAEKLAFSNSDIVDALTGLDTDKPERAPKSVEVLMQRENRIYDTPDKGILWGWEVSGYVWTKAIAAGVFLVWFIGWLMGDRGAFADLQVPVAVTGLIFLALTGVLLVLDLDQPRRFLYVLLRPQWNSWLTRGAYAITGYGGLLTLWGLAAYFEWQAIAQVTTWLTLGLALLTAIYTAFLFAQARGRDFWQSPSLALHMLVHSVMAGGATLVIMHLVSGQAIPSLLATTLILALVVNALTLTAELATTHATAEAKRTVAMIVHGRYQAAFWIGSVLIGCVLPFVLLLIGITAMPLWIASVAILIGILVTERIWVEAPQRIPLT